VIKTGLIDPAQVGQFFSVGAEGHAGKRKQWQKTRAW
jgi:hypothetical protein